MNESEKEQIISEGVAAAYDESRAKLAQAFVDRFRQKMGEPGWAGAIKEMLQEMALRKI